MLSGPLLFGLLIALLVLVAFGAIWRLAGRPDPVEDRLKKYGVDLRGATRPETGGLASRRPRLVGFNRLLAGFGLGPGLAAALAQADLPLTAAEFILIALAAGVSGFLVGSLRGGPFLGLAVGLLCLTLPVFFLRYRQGNRRKALTTQLPEMLTLMVGALRSGNGLTQALGVLADQMQAPMSAEVGRTMRGVSLGLPVQKALTDMAARVGTDEMDMVVTAINVQYEIGGNLAQTLETIGDTVRERLRIRREIQALTAQQRLTGYILAVLPIGLAFALYLIQPEYIGRLFEPGWIRLVPVAAGLMQVAGFLVIRRIVDIEV